MTEPLYPNLHLQARADEPESVQALLQAMADLISALCVDVSLMAEFIVARQYCAEEAPTATPAHLHRALVNLIVDRGHPRALRLLGLPDQQPAGEKPARPMRLAVVDGELVSGDTAAENPSA